MISGNMRDDDQSHAISLVKTLAEAASDQAKFANRIWLATISTVILAFLPSTDGQPKRIDLPFNLGTALPDQFYPVMFAILSILMVALAVAHAQQLRTDRFAQNALDDLIGDASGDAPVPLFLRDIFDILRHPSLTRVAPLCQEITDDYHSLQDERRTKSDTKLKGITNAGTYLFLKVFAFLILFLVPMFGLFAVYLEVDSVWSGWKQVMITVIGVLAIISLLVVAWRDSKLVLHHFIKMLRKDTWPKHSKADAQVEVHGPTNGS